MAGASPHRVHKRKRSPARWIAAGQSLRGGCGRGFYATLNRRYLNHQTIGIKPRPPRSDLQSTIIRSTFAGDHVMLRECPDKMLSG
jgi:hypothetical protein